MAKMIEGVTENILKCAKEEFLANGYENASLRNIAEKAGTTKSSLLYRYSDKEALYHSIVPVSYTHLSRPTHLLSGRMNCPK